LSRFFSGILFKHFSHSSGLPDNVFDAGERPAKLVQKRVKVGFLTQVNLTPRIYTEPLERKGAGKSSNTSPDMPNKRQRLVFAHSSFMRIWDQSRFVYASSLSPFCFFLQVFTIDFGFSTQDVIGKWIRAEFATCD
jgi:hypothetical protein